MVRRIALITILTLTGSATVLAQRGGGGFHGGGMGGGFHGGGMGGGFRGGGMGGGFRGGGMGGGFRGGMGGGFRGGMGGGFRGNNGFRGNFGFRNRFNQFGFSPFFNNGFWPWWGAWGWPLWGGWPLWDSSWDSGGGYQPASYAPSGGYPYPENYSAGPAPVIINQNLGSAPAPPPPAPAISEYTAPPIQVTQSNEPPLFLLAFQDGMIRAVLAYWVDGTTLHYVTLEHEQKQAPLSSVDRTLSERLNHERNVTFQLAR